MVALPGAWALLSAMRDCLCEAIEGSGRPVCFCGILAGALAVHDYGDDGQAWVRLVTTFPTESFPQPAGAGGRCGSAQAYQVEVGIIRCAALAEMDGTPADVQEQEYAAEVQMADMELMRQAIACCVGSNYEYVLGQYLPMGPAGGVVGGAWTFYATRSF